MALLSHELQLLNATFPFPYEGFHLMTREQLEASGASAWGTPLEGLQGALIFYQLYQNVIFCPTLRERHKTPDFIKLSLSLLPLSPELREVDQKAAVGCQCPLMLDSPLT